MPGATHESCGGGVEEEKTKDSGKRDDPGRGMPAEGQVWAPVHGGDLGHDGGDPGDEKKEEELDSSIDGRATTSDGGDLEEDQSEEGDAPAEGLVTSGHGDGRTEAKEAAPGTPASSAGGGFLLYVLLYLYLQLLAVKVFCNIALKSNKMIKDESIYIPSSHAFLGVLCHL